MTASSYYGDMTKLAEAICKACGVEMGTISRLSLTLDYNGSMPVLELERPLTAHHTIKGAGERLAALCGSGTCVKLVEMYGSEPRTEYVMEERVGDCWRRLTFATLEEMMEATDGRQANGTIRPHTEAVRPPERQDPDAAKDRQA